MSAGLITKFEDAGGGSTTVTSAGHGLPNLATVFIEDTTSYNGQFEIASVATDTYDIVTAFVADDATGRYVTDTSPFSLSTSIGPTVTSGSAGAKGSWSHAFTTSEEINWLNIMLNPLAIGDQAMEIDIGTGLDSAEVVKLTFPCFINFNPGSNVVLPPVPVQIPAGIEVKIRISSSSASQGIGYTIAGNPDDSYGTSIANEGIGLGTRQGTDIDPGGTDNVKGSYAELSSSTSNENNYLLICLGNSSNTAQTSQNYIVDLAKGASSSELNLRPPIMFNSHSSELPSIFIGTWVTIPASSRITGRCQSDNVVVAGTDDRLIDMAVIGFTVVAPSGGGGGGAKLAGQGGGLVG